MFQYISCYSLSASAERITVLYPKFQYISCYSLSRKGMGYGTSGMRVSIHLMLLFIWLCLYKVSCGLMFQYISCYSLSLSTPPEVKQRMSFQYISCYSLSKPHYFPNREMMCFNTSHVTLYLCNIIRQCCDANVSIHLMLLFIKHSFFVLLWQDIVSIHLMLLFISCY